MDNTQALVDAHATARLVANLRARVRGTVGELRAALEAFDAVRARRVHARLRGSAGDIACREGGLAAAVLSQ